MKLTAEEKQMIENMRLANNALSNEDNYRNVRAGFNSSLEIMIVAGLNSPHTEVREKAQDLQNQMRARMVEQGVNHVGALQFTESEYNYLLVQANEATKIDSNLGTEYSLVVDSANMYNDPLITDEVYSEITKLKLEEIAPRNSDDGMSYDVIVNETTGTVFRKDRTTGVLTPNMDAMEEYEQSRANSDELFIASGGEQQGGLTGLEDK